MKKTIRFIPYLCLLFLFIGYNTLKSKNDSSNNNGYSWEEYNPSFFYKLQSVNDIIKYADSAAGKHNRQTLDYVRLLNRLIASRFYHGYSYYSFQNNWITYVSGKLFWSNLSAIVLPDDILKYPHAACSQVSIVLAACLKKIDVSCRKIGLQGHFVLEAKLNNNWFMFDPNLEPRFPNGRKSLKNLIKGNELYTGYAGKKPLPELKNIFSHIEYGRVNTAMAPHATVFHQVTSFLSPFIIFILSLYVAIDLIRFIVSKSRFKKVTWIAIPLFVERND